MIASGFGVMISNDHNASDSASKSMSFGSTDSNEEMGSFTGNQDAYRKKPIPLTF
jgi:hypothetical protein